MIPEKKGEILCLKIDIKLVGELDSLVGILSSASHFSMYPNISSKLTSLIT